MDSLDINLRKVLSDSVIILEANRDVGPRKYEVALNLFFDDAIAKVKQVLADEGYLHYVQSPSMEFVLPSPGTTMTGQEWYDRFWASYETENPKVADSTIVREQVDAIAKEAAGIK